jgi:hypothetical protein
MDYNLSLSKAFLKQKCIEFGLSDKGVKLVLINRLFLILQMIFLNQA